jgi:hypothetical protein
MTKKSVLDVEKAWEAFNARALSKGKESMDEWAAEHGLKKSICAIILRTAEDAEMTEGKYRAKAVTEAQIDDAQIDENEAH